MKTIFLFAFIAISSIGFSQITLLSEDFEGAISWNKFGVESPNTWINNSCSGNGPSAAGDSSLHITNNTVGVCTTGSQKIYAYDNHISAGSVSIVTYTKVFATCASNMEISFDYSIDGNSGEDFGELVYSTDGGASFVSIGGEYISSSGWTSTTVSLPALLDETIFEIGFRFTYNDANLYGDPFAIDNIVITGVDITNPIITCVAAEDFSVLANCEAYATDFSNYITALSDNCTDSVNISISQNIPIGTLLSAVGGTENVILTATDDAGNFSQCAFALNIVDTVSPTIICPSDTVEYLDASCNGSIPDYFSMYTVSDNCTSIGSLLLNQSPIAGTSISGHGTSTAMTLTVEDEYGNTNTCMFNVVATDSTVATIICPNDTVQYVDGACATSLSDYTDDAIVSDNCIGAGSLTVSQSPIAGTGFSTGNQIITLTVSGGYPNIDQSCTFNLAVIDSINPSITCPVPGNYYVDNNCELSMPNLTGGVIVSDNCAIASVLQSPLAGTTMTSVDNGITINMIVSDVNGNINSCSFSLPILDTISPVINCPGNQTIDGDANCQANIIDYTSLASVTDNCTESVAISQSPAPGTLISSTTTITLTGTDESGNTGSCTFDVSIVDVTAPIVTCPSNTSVSSDASCQHSLTDYTGSASANDNCSAAINLIYSQSPAPSAILNAGVNPITIYSEDEAGNIGQCIFNLTVEDQINPTISCPSNQVVYATTSCDGVLSDYTGLASVGDNCSSVANITVSQSPLSGSTITTDQSIVLTAMDEAGNQQTCSFFAVLTDTIKPTIVCPSDESIAADANCDYTLPDYTGNLTGSDNCSSFGNMTVSQNPAPGTTQNGSTAILFTLTDEAGNSSNCTMNVLPIDTTDPVITCPSPAPINNGTSCDYIIADYSSLSSVIENCSGYTVAQTPAPGSTINAGTNNITLVVTDAAGNQDQCSFDLQIIESQNPTISCPSVSATCDPIVTYADPTVSDNCSASFFQSDVTGYTSGDLFPVGITTIEYTAIDSSGNTSTCTFNVEVIEYASPATITEDTIYICGVSSAVLNADPIVSGTGTWSVGSGQGTFTNANASTTGVNNVGLGANQYYWSVYSPSCGSNLDSVIVIRTQEDLPASTQDIYHACNQTDVILQANAPLYGTGTWTTDGPGSILSVNSANTTSTFGPGWQNFIWTISNPGCPSTSDTLQVYGSITPEISQNDTLFCLEETAIALTGTEVPNDTQSSWLIISGSGSLSEYTGSTTIVTSLGLGNNLIMYTFEHAICADESDTIIITGTLCDDFDPIIPTVFTPGNMDGQNDLFTIDYLATAYPECRVFIFNRWGDIVFESIGYADAWDGRFNGELLPLGTYFYRIELNDEEGRVITGDINIIH